MPQVINTNVASLNAQRNLNTSQSSLNQALQRLSSGLRINSAKDDAAGLAISERMTSQIRGLNQAVRNANDGVSLSQTAEGALQQTGNLLQRIRELAVQSSNATNSASDRAALQQEVGSLQNELNRIASNTTFNGLKILDGTYSAQNFQIGADSNQTIGVTLSGMATAQVGNYAVTGSNTGTSRQGTGNTAAAAAAIPAANTIAGQTLTVSGPQGQTTASVNAGDSAYTVAAAINSITGSTGVTAKATNSATVNNLGAAGTVTMDIGSGSGTVTVSATVTTTSLDALVTAINNASGSTGVSATGSGSSFTLAQADGKDIQIGNFTNTGGGVIRVQGSAGLTAETLSNTGNDSTVVAGTVSLNASGAFSASSSVATGAGSVFSVAAATSVASTSQFVSQINISQVSNSGTGANAVYGAQSAIDIIDSALAKVSGTRATLGALQSRFESAISNLQTTSENLAAARSRIQDADFAAETAALTRSQILQQAGVAMLAQANAMPNNVLSLLK